MAVKQHVSELAHSQPKYDISKIIELIEMIQANPETIPKNAASLKAICEKIVVYLAHTPVEREAHEIKIMKNEIGKINKFFQELWNHANEHFNDIVTACLSELYKQITSNEETSNYASAVLVLVEKHMIKPAVRFILQQAENPTAIKKIFKTLSNWLETDDYAPDLTTWVLEILIGLQDHQSLLVELSSDIFVSYSMKLFLPFYRPKLGPVVLCILKLVRHTPVVFHLIIPKASVLLHELSKPEKATSQPSNLLQCFVDTLSALLLHFPANDQLYQELEECLQKYPTSKNFRQTLDVPPWHDTSQNVMVVSTNPRVGLVNLGNTCYMNSVLQALVMTKQFSREILLSEIDAPLFFQIQKLLALLLHSTRPELTPRALLAAARPPDFVPGYQQDSSEFLGYLLEKLHEQEKKWIKNQYFEADVNNKLWPSQNEKTVQLETMPSKHPNEANQLSFSGAECLHHAKEVQFNESLLSPTLIQKTFDGKLFVTYQCGDCGSKSTNLDAFRSFELSFPEPSDLDTDYSVQKLLDFYCSSEKLIGDNQYYCDKCKRLCDGERSIRIMKSPKNLILTLKHFRYDQQRHTRAKLMNKVLHDEVISLKVVPEMEPPTMVRYSLYAAVVHAGTSMDSGHYYTYAQDEPDCWYKFNDNFVTKCSVDELHALSSPNTPYILFYQMLVPSAIDGRNVDCLELDEDMDETTAIVKTPPNISMASSTSATNCQLPELKELPSRLREIVHGDNQSYTEEIRNESRKMTQQRVGSSKFVLPKNHDSDNDDPPPNSCGSNSIDYSNRFIY